MRTEEQREQRQQAVRQAASERATFEEDYGELLDLREAARFLKVSRETARRLLRQEPGVVLLRAPGRSRPMIRVERSILERLLRRSANR